MSEASASPSRWRSLLSTLKTIALAILIFLLIALLFLAAGATAYVGLNRLAFKSKPCQVAVNYATHDPAVAKVLGPVQDCRLPWLADYSYDETLDTGLGHFKLHAVGAKAAGTVDVQLEKLKRQWTVTSCTVTKDPEPLSSPKTKPAAK